MQVGHLHNPLPQFAPSAISKQHVVGHDDAGTATGAQRAHDVFYERQAACCSSPR